VYPFSVIGMTTESSTAAAVTAGTVRLANGRTANARRTAVAGAAPIVRFADSAGRARTASADVAETFTPIATETIEQAHGVALIEAAGHGVRILTQITVDQHDAAFAGAPWPVTGPAQLTGQSDAIRVAVAGQWYQLTRVQMPSGECRRFARQYNGYGDGPKDVREASMLFGCAWSSVEVVAAEVDPIGPTPCAVCGVQGHTEREHEAPVDILPEHEQALINAAADELRRIADDADREAAEAHEVRSLGGDPAASILAEPDVDTSGCSNPWHRTAGLYSRRACSECPPVARAAEDEDTERRAEISRIEGLALEAGRAGLRDMEQRYYAQVRIIESALRRPVESVELPPLIELTPATERLLVELEAHQLNDKVDAVASVGLPLSHGAVADALIAAVRPALAVRPAAENGDQSGARTPDPPHAAGAGPAVTTNRTEPQTP